ICVPCSRKVAIVEHRNSHLEESSVATHATKSAAKAPGCAWSHSRATTQIQPDALRWYEVTELTGYPFRVVLCKITLDLYVKLACGHRTAPSLTRLTPVTSCLRFASN